MPGPVHDFSYDECEAWMGELGVTWEKLIKAGAIGKTMRYNVKSRWGENTEQMGAIYDELMAAEMKRAEHTDIGAQMLALEEWGRIGRMLYARPDRFKEEVARLRPIAEAARHAAELQRDAERAQSAFENLTAAPKKPRK